MKLNFVPNDDIKIYGTVVDGKHSIFTDEKPDIKFAEINRNTTLIAEDLGT